MQIEGWGVDSTYPSEVLDTILSLDALAAAGLSDANQIQGAMEFLLFAQRDDGSWGYGDNLSDVHLTGAVLGTLVRHRALFSVEEAIGRGIAFLQAKYGPDGTIGEGLTAAAMAYESAIAAGTNVAASFPATSSYLKSAQATNGSWDEDEYTTAVVLRALSLEKPNLAVQRGDVVFSQPFPREGETVSITALVRNAGPAAAENVVVRLVDGNAPDGVAVGEPIIIALMPAYASTSVSASWNTTGRAGNRRIVIQADPDDAIAENCETDNTASVDVIVSTLPDLVVGSGDVQISPAIARSSDEVVVTATVRNTGQTAADGFSAFLYDGSPESGGRSLGSQSVPNLAGGAEAVLTWKGYLAAGTHHMTVVVDPGQAVVEMSEGNNRALASLYVYPPEAAVADLEVSSLGVQPPVINEVETAVVQAIVKNAGRVDAQGFTVELWKKDGIGAASLVASTEVPGLVQDAQATLIWTVSLPAGDYDLTAKVDATDLVGEGNETNNEGTCRLRVLTSNATLPDLALDASELDYQPLNPTSQDVITIKAVLRNLGNAVATGPLDVGTGVNLYDGDPDSGGTYLGGMHFDAVQPGAEFPLFMTTSLPVGSHDVYVVVDSGHVIAELDESNNALSLHVEVRPPLPDLSASMGDVSFAPLFPTDADPVTISASVRNFSSVGAQGVRLVLREGPPPGGAVLLDTIVADVPGNGWASVQALGQFSLGEHQLFLEIDPDDAIEEWNEANNVSSHLLVVVTPPDLAIDAGTLVVTPAAPAAGRRVTLSAEIRNLGESAADSAVVAFYDGDPEAGAPLGEPLVLAKVHGQSQVRAEKSFFLSSGSHDIHIVIDPGDLVRESTEANNAAVQTLLIGEEVNLAFVGEPSLSPSEPVATEATVITALVRNEGTVPAEGVLVTFSDGHLEAEVALLGEVAVPTLPGGAEVPVSLAATFDAGYHEVVAALDSPGDVTESNELDNETVVGVYVAVPEGDVVIKRAGLSVDPANPVAGSTFALGAEVWNFGNFSRPGVTVAFYDGADPDWTLLGQVQTDLAPGASAVASLNSVLSAGEHVITVVADPDGLLQEASVINNRVSKTVSVAAGAPGIYQDSGNPAVNSHCVQGTDAVLTLVPAELAPSVRTVSVDPVAVRYSFDGMAVDGAYRLTVVAIQDPGGERVQKVSIDGKLVVSSYEVPADAPASVTVAVPKDAYQDGVISVSVEGLNGAGALVSELYLVPESGQKELAIYRGASWLEQRGNTWANGKYVGWDAEYDAIRTAKAFAAYRANGRTSHPNFEILRQRLYSLQAPDYSWEMDVVVTAEAIIALMEAGEEGGGERISNAVQWLRRQANADGAWGRKKGMPSSARTTGVALAALVIAGVDKADTACTQAVQWLKATQNATGYWGPSPGGSDDINAGPWPAIGLTLATSLSDPEALAARIRLSSLTVAYSSWYSVWEDYCQMSLYCGSSLSMDFSSFQSMAQGQTQSGGWVPDSSHYLYPEWYVTASALETLGKAGWASIGGGMSNLDRGFAWLDAHLTEDGRASNLMTELTHTASSAVVMALQQSGAWGSAAALDRAARTLVEQQHYWRRGFWSDGFFIDSHGHTAASAHAIIALSSTSWASSGAAGGAASLLGQWQNPDGGWSYYKFYSSLVYETALILDALLKAGYAPDGTTITRGMAWLLSKQGADGGWSNTTDTAQAARALLAEGRHQTELDRALDWILGTQNVDGSWGSTWGQPGNVDTTSQALVALAAAGERGTAVGRGVSWLLSARNSDNGWGAIPRGESSSTWSTALAVWALAVSHPNRDVELEVLFNKPWYYPADLVSMIVNPLNETVGSLTMSGSLQDQDGASVGLPVVASDEGFQSEYVVPPDAVPGLISVTFLATSDDAQGAQTAAFVVKNAANTLPDLEVFAEDILLDKDTVRPGEPIACAVTIRNAGMIDAHGVTVRLYRGAERTLASQIGTDVLVERVAGLGASTASLTIVADEDLHQLLVVVDPDEGVAETREDNNAASRWVYVDAAAARPDLQLSAEGISVAPGAPYAGETLTATIVVRNAGTAPAAASVLRLYDADPRVGGSVLGSDADVPSLSPGESATVPTAVDTAGRSGRLYVYAVADPNDGMAEESETNNVAFSFVELRQMPLPDLVIAGDGLATSKATAVEGESVAVSVTVVNRGAAASNVAVGVYDGDPTSGGLPIAAFQTIPGILQQSGSATRTFTWSTAGAGGPHQLHAVADPGGVIAETFEDNNSASVALDVADTQLNLEVSTSQASYGPNEAVPIALSVANLAEVAAGAMLEVSIQDAAGTAIADIAAEPVSLAGNEARSLAYAWNTASNRDGGYTVSARLAQDGRTVVVDTTGIAIRPDLAVAAAAATDKASYGPNETARVTWSFSSQSVNHDFANLAATLSVTDPSGATLLTDQRAVASLVRGQRLSFASYWGVATQAPGTYPLSVRLTAGPDLLASATGSLTIQQGIDPATSLSGTITAAPQTVFSGEAVALTYAVRNIGNRDLPDLQLRIKVVGALHQTELAELTNGAALDRGAELSAAPSLSTPGFGAGDYLVVLVAETEGVSGTLASTYFRIQGAPSAPSVNAPADGVRIGSATPALIVNNAADPNALDELTYSCELHGDEELAQLVAAYGPAEEGQGTTGWAIAEPLAENTHYWWRCRAFDGWSYGPWMQPATFFVNIVNDPPGPPAVDHPLDGQGVDVLQPSLLVRNAFDPDEDLLTYNFLVASDPALANVVAETVGVFETTGTTSWRVDPPLSENTWYWWSAQADDWLDVGPWMASASFFVNTANDAPTSPVPVAPDESAETEAAVTLTVANAVDPDSTLLTYAFELDAEPTFSSPALIASPALAEGAGTTSWDVPVSLAENTRYHWRAKASDGQAESPWTVPFSFFVNELNEAPSTPVLANPSDGGEVILLQPELAIRNATDPDGDVLSYEFQVYGDADLVVPAASVSSVPQGEGGTSWTIAAPLADNTRYWWRCRAFDGELAGGWMPAASFTVNTANDAPTPPTLIAPSGGAVVDSLQPALTIANALDPDGDVLSYQFEVYEDAALTMPAVSTSSTAEGDGSTTWPLPTALQDDRQYWWRARASDGECYGPWMETATFTVHLPVQSIAGTINFDPDTLNLGSRGTWVTVYVEVPAGYDAWSIDPATVMLNAVVRAETKPAAYGDADKDGIRDVMLKFRRSAVEAILLPGEHVVVEVTGMAGTMAFEGIDIIRVINP